MAMNSEYPTNNYAPQYPVAQKRGFDPFWVLAGVVFVQVVIIQFIWSASRYSDDLSSFFSNVLFHFWGIWLTELLVAAAALLARSSMITRILLLAYFPVQGLQQFTVFRRIGTGSSALADLEQSFGLTPQDNGNPFWFGGVGFKVSDLAYLNLGNFVSLAKVGVIIWCLIYILMKKSAQPSSN